MSLAQDDVGSSETAQEIARVATRLFAARGYDATPVHAIVEAAGVTKPTLYYHFKSKEGLALAILRRPLIRLVADLAAGVAGAGDPVEGLLRFMETHDAFVREDPDRLRFFHAIHFGPVAPGFVHELAGFGQRVDAILRSAIAAMADAGVIAAGRAEAFFTVVRGMIIVTALDSLCCGPVPGPDHWRRLVDDLLRGFAEPGTYRGRT